MTNMMSDLSELSELSEDEELPEDAGSTEPVGSGADDDDAVLSDNMDATVGGTESGLRGNIPSLRRTQRVYGEWPNTQSESDGEQNTTVADGGGQTTPQVDGQEARNASDTPMVANPQFTSEFAALKETLGEIKDLLTTFVSASATHHDQLSPFAQESSLSSTSSDYSTPRRVSKNKDVQRLRVSCIRIGIHHYLS